MEFPYQIYFVSRWWYCRLSPNKLARCYRFITKSIKSVLKSIEITMRFIFSLAIWESSIQHFYINFSLFCVSMPPTTTTQLVFYFISTQHSFFILLFRCTRQSSSCNVCLFYDVSSEGITLLCLIYYDFMWIKCTRVFAGTPCERHERFY